MTPRVGGRPLTKKSDTEGSEVGDPLRTHAFNHSEREGVMVTPSASMHNRLNYRLCMCDANVDAHTHSIPIPHKQ